MKVGDRVRYIDVCNLHDKGAIVSIGKTRHGGDCVVKWDGTGVSSEECLSNLIPAKE